MAARIVLIAVAISAGLTCYQAAPAQTVFKAGVMAVRLDVLVSDNGRPVEGLSAEDFEIWDNGVPQRAVEVGQDRAGVDVGLVLDASASVAGERLRELVGAAGAVLDGLGPGDRSLIISFGRDVRLLSPLTGSPSAAKAALGRLSGWGTTALNDAVCSAALVLKQDARRSLVIVFSDGLDNSSWLGPEQLYDTLARADVVVYAVRPDWSRSFQTVGREHGIVLERLTAQTGGDVLTATSSGLSQAFHRVLEEFRRRYYLAFTPTGVRSGDGWHTLRVRLKTGRGKVQARSRYYSGAQ